MGTRTEPEQSLAATTDPSATGRLKWSTIGPRTLTPAAPSAGVTLVSRSCTTVVND